jgi:hypothetical protein
MDAELGSSKIRDAVVVPDPPVQDRVLVLDHDLVVVRAPAQGIIVVLDPDQGTVEATLCHLLFFSIHFI